MKGGNHPYEFPVNFDLGNFLSRLAKEHKCSIAEAEDRVNRMTNMELLQALHWHSHHVLYFKLWRPRKYP